MGWISINPGSEPSSAVKLAAYITNTTPEKITPEEMADAYNEADEYLGEASDKADSAQIDNFVNSISSLLDDPIDDEEVDE